MLPDLAQALNPRAGPRDPAGSRATRVIVGLAKDTCSFQYTVELMLT